MMNRADARRRWVGLFCLAVAFGMLVWGQTVLKPHLDGFLYLIYWAICFLCTLAAVFIALVDVRVLRQRTRQQQRDLLERTLEEIDDSRREKKKKSSP